MVVVPTGDTTRNIKAIYKKSVSPSLTAISGFCQLKCKPSITAGYNAATADMDLFCRLLTVLYTGPYTTPVAPRMHYNSKLMPDCTKQWLKGVMGNPQEYSMCGTAHAESRGRAYLVPSSISTQAIQRSQVLEGHHCALRPSRDTFKPLCYFHGFPWRLLKSKLRHWSPCNPSGCCHDGTIPGVVLPIPANPALCTRQ